MACPGFILWPNLARIRFNAEAVKQAAVDDVVAITGGSLDYLIANAALVNSIGAYDPIGVL